MISTLALYPFIEGRIGGDEGHVGAMLEFEFGRTLKNGIHTR